MSVAQPIKTDIGCDCSECYRSFASMRAFNIHIRTGSCKVGQSAGLIGELSRSNQIVWSDVDLDRGIT